MSRRKLIAGNWKMNKTVAEAVAAIQDWLTGVFKPVADGLAAIGKVIQDLIDGLFKLFGGSGTVSLTGMLTAAGTSPTFCSYFEAPVTLIDVACIPTRH